MTGLDGYLFMEEFSAYFKIDMAGYNPNKYHRSEGDIVNFPKMFFNKIFRKKTNELHYFTTNHLLNECLKKCGTITFLLDIIILR